eukprot:860256-Pelagomonas_calceolata.AAC.3
MQGLGLERGQVRSLLLVGRPRVELIGKGLRVLVMVQCRSRATRGGPCCCCCCCCCWTTTAGGHAERVYPVLQLLGVALELRTSKQPGRHGCMRQMLHNDRWKQERAGWDTSSKLDSTTLSQS